MVAASDRCYYPVWPRPCRQLKRHFRNAAASGLSKQAGVLVFADLCPLALPRALFAVGSLPGVLSSRQVSCTVLGHGARLSGNTGSLHWQHTGGVVEVVLVSLLRLSAFALSCSTRLCVIGDYAQALWLVQHLFYLS